MAVCGPEIPMPYQRILGSRREETFRKRHIILNASDTGRPKAENMIIARPISPLATLVLGPILGIFILLQPTPAWAQEVSTTSPTEALQEAQDTPAGDITSPNSALPPNITITTPDGKPLSPDLLAKVLEALKDDPAVLAALKSPIRDAVRTQIDDTEIVVVAKRPRGAVIGDVPPTRTFDPLDIRAYGARDIEDLIGSLDSEVVSLEGGQRRQPIVLLNGRRIAGFEEIANYPTEAIERLEVFPEDLALQYGFPANRKVVNVVTFDPFRSTNVNAFFAMPTEGGRSTKGGSVRFLKLSGGSRYNLNLGFEASGNLLESERRIAEPPDASGQSSFRTLLPSTRQLTVGGTFGDQVFGELPLTLAANAFSTRNEALLGRSEDKLIRQLFETHGAGASVSLSGSLTGWLWFAKISYDLGRTRVSTGPDIRDSAKSQTASSNFLTDASLTGTLFALPAGRVSTTVRTDYSRNFLNVRSSVPDGSDAELVRDRGSVFATLDVPLSSRYVATPTWLGTLSLNAQAGVEHLTYFDTLSTYGYGLYWSPVEELRLNGSISNQQSAPTIEQLGSPRITSPNFRTFDYVQGETVDVVRTFGGNALLQREDREIVSIGATLKPRRGNVAIIANFTRTTTQDPILSFPIVTQPIQAAFPERFVRNDAGRLTAIDSSPLNLAKNRQSQMRWGINFTRSLGRLPEGADLIVSPTTDGTIPAGTLPPNSRVIESPPGTPLPPEIENAISRLYFSLYHTWHFEDSVVIRAGDPKLSLLDGFALDGRFGRPRHEVELSGGAFKRGLGGRFRVAWKSDSTLRGLPLEASSKSKELRFSTKPSIDLSLFLNPEDRIVGAAPAWLRKVQLVLAVENLLNDRPLVADADGAIPLNYQGVYLDPIGRTLRLSMRRIF